MNLVHYQIVDHVYRVNTIVQTHFTTKSLYYKYDIKSIDKILMNKGL